LDRFKFLLDLLVRIPIFESIQEAFALTNWIDTSPKEAIMHPIKHLFDDINRNYWGIDQCGHVGEGNAPSRIRRRLFRRRLRR
jgi:hypothetical protein